MRNAALERRAAPANGQKEEILIGCIGNLNTSRKLAIGFGLAIVMVGVTGLVGYQSLKTLDSVVQGLNTNSVAGLDSLVTIHGGIEAAGAVMINTAMADYQEDAVKEFAGYEKLRAEIEEGLKAFEGSISRSDERAVFDELQAEWKKADATYRKVAELAGASETLAARELCQGDASVARKACTAAVDRLTELKRAQSRALTQASTRTYSRAVATILASVLVAIAACTVLSLLISRIVSSRLSVLRQGIEEMSDGPVNDLSEAMKALANADLSYEVKSRVRPLEVCARDDLSLIAQTFNDMAERMAATTEAYAAAQESLRCLVQLIGDHASVLSETSSSLSAVTEQSGQASSEVAEGSTRLAHSASEAASTMEQLHASACRVQSASEEQLDHVSEAVAQLGEAASIATQVAGSAEDVAQVAQKGQSKVLEIMSSNERVSEQVEASAQKVRQLDEASTRIGAIVSSIEQIAEQTNLLALNAAIEAARAGEHGRGFAVVAEEVRKLAEEAGSATREIAGLIEDVRSNVTETVAAITGTIPLVEAGTQLSSEAGSSLEEIAEAVRGLAGEAQGVSKSAKLLASLMERVHDSSRANQSEANDMVRGAQEVSGSIQGVAAFSEETAASAQEMSASVHEVSESARKLNEIAEELRETVARFKTGSSVETKAHHLRLAS